MAGERTFPLMSRQEIEGLISEGRQLIILDQYVLKADAWLPYHPGGDLAIRHMVGRDATDEINGLHSLEARQMMDKYRVGRIEGRWNNFIPPIQGGTYRSRVQIEADEATTEDDAAAASTSSTQTSRAPSPVFDSAGIRKRAEPAGTSTASVSSLSSVDDADEPQIKDAMSFINATTREKINLDLDKYPPLDDETQDRIVEKYRALGRRIKAEGLYQCNYTAYAWECFRYCTFFALMLLCLHWKWYALAGVFQGAFWHQLSFTAHDAGHMGITHNFHVDTGIGIFIADFLGGLSIGWWKRSHNVHHIMTNAPNHDPDIQYVPIFAPSHRFLESLRSTYYSREMPFDAAARLLIPYQHFTYYLVMLFARFNLYRLSWEYLLLGQAPKKGPARYHRYFELLGQLVFWTWWGYGIVYKTIDNGWGRFAFVIVAHMFAAPLHVQITLSHFAMSTANLGPNESFPQRQLRTTMDVDCPKWLDFFHGGLQFQAIHHLYPRIPRHNLRRTQKLVQDFCNEVEIPYALYGFVDGNKMVIGSLAEVARQAAILAKCQSVLAASDDPLHDHHHH